MNKNFYEFFGLNEILFTKINQLTNIGIMPEILSIISSLFFITNFAVCYIITCIYLYFRIIRHKKPTEYFNIVYDELFRIGTCYAFFGFTFAGLKFSFNMPRPFCSLEPQQFITIANTEVERCLSSFPSAHTGLSILVTYVLWKYTNKTLKTFLCALIALVAISRITLAMHYPADIIYSAFVTMIVIKTSNIIYHNILKSKIANPIKKIIIKLILF